MASRTGRFRRADRLLKTIDFQRVGRRGRRFGSEAFVVLTASPRGGGATRSQLGVTVSRRVGNAVARSRVKRHVREWFRHERSRFRQPVDVVVIARRDAVGLGGVEVTRRLNELLFSTGTNGDQ